MAVEQPLILNTRTLSFNKKDNFTNSIWSKDSKKELNTRVKEIKLY